MAAFKLKMGISNYAILNTLWKKEEMMVMVQQGQAAADHDDAEQAAEGEQEVEQQPPPPAAQIPQIDGTLSSTPSRSNGSPHMMSMTFSMVMTSHREGRDADKNLK